MYKLQSEGQEFVVGVCSEKSVIDNLNEQTITVTMTSFEQVLNLFTSFVKHGLSDLYISRKAFSSQSGAKKMRQNLHLDSGADRLMLQLLLHCGTLGSKKKKKKKKSKKKNKKKNTHLIEYKSNNNIRPTMCNACTYFSFEWNITQVNFIHFVDNEWIVPVNNAAVQNRMQEMSFNIISSPHSFI